MFNWIKKNKEWLFSGLFIYLIGWGTSEIKNAIPFLNHSYSIKGWHLIFFIISVLASFGSYFRLRNKRLSNENKLSKIDNEELNKKIIELIEIDPLTNMHNLRRIERFFEEELSTYLEERKEVWGIMLDINKFDEKTRDLSITQGSDLLELVGKRWKSNKEKDVVARWGGDEFLVISPNENLQSILGFTERLLRDLSETPFYVGIGNKNVKIELSATAGISKWNKNGDNERMFQDRLGKLMKEAKEEGIEFKI